MAHEGQIEETVTGAPTVTGPGRPSRRSQEVAAAERYLTVVSMRPLVAPPPAPHTEVEDSCRVGRGGTPLRTVHRD